MAVDTRQPKMGGKPTLRVLVQESPDLVASLLSPAAWGNQRGTALQKIIRDKYGGAFNIELIPHPAARSDLLLQELEQVAPPVVLRREAFEHDLDMLVGPSENGRIPGDVDIVVLSLLPEVIESVWAHQDSGYLVDPPVGWKEAWTPRQRDWLRANFAPTGLLSADESKGNLIRVIRAAKERLDAHVIVLNCSPLDPDDLTHNYYGLEDTLALRVRKLNLAIMQLSASEGISIIDVERLVAELGGEHVLKALLYSDEAHRAVSQEFLRVVEDIGFFQERPLLMQIGQRDK
jgi:hypothetical protein